MKVFKDATANGSNIVSLENRNTDVGRTGDTYFFVAGVLGGASVTFEASADGDKFVPLTSSTFTTNAVKAEKLPRTSFVKCTITGATGTTNIDVDVL